MQVTWQRLKGARVRIALRIALHTSSDLRRPDPHRERRREGDRERWTWSSRSTNTNTKSTEEKSPMRERWMPMLKMSTWSLGPKMIRTLTPRLGFLFLSRFKCVSSLSKYWWYLYDIEDAEGFWLLICCLKFWEEEDELNSVIYIFFLILMFLIFSMSLKICEGLIC